MPTYIPAGFTLESYIDNNAEFELYYTDGKQYFYFSTRNIYMGITLDTETASYDFSHRINGLSAIIEENRGMFTIMWQDDITSFMLETNLSLDSALAIAASYNLQENF